jgi:23S rRNA pseudouridine1911/1915/1917 synthase
VIGDPTYGGRKKRLSPDASERSLAAALLDRLRRQALHASRLEFAHPITGTPLRFESALPEDITLALEELRAYRDRAGR